MNLKSPRLRLALRVVALAAVGALVYYSFRDLDFAGLGRALKGASLGWVFAAAILYSSIQVARAGFWKTILTPVISVPAWVMLRYTIAASAWSVVLPARGGEALRVWWLTKRHDVPLSVLVAGVAFEKALDATILVLLISPLPWLLEKQSWLHPVRYAVPIALVAMPLAVALARKLRSRIRFLADVRVFDSLGTLFASVGWAAAAWGLDVSTVCSAMVAVSIPLHLDAVMLVILMVNMAVAVPAAPGNLGTFELGATFALTTLGVPSERAAAFALLYHGVQIVPQLLVWAAVALSDRGKPDALRPS